MKQIGVNAIANNAITTPKIADDAITSSKPAESFMKTVNVFDTPDGHAVGWNPDGVTKGFTITDSDVGPRHESFVSLYFPSTLAPPDGNDQSCSYSGQGSLGGSFGIGCDIAPPDGTTLHYMVTRLPAHEIG